MKTNLTVLSIVSFLLIHQIPSASAATIDKSNTTITASETHNDSYYTTFRFDGSTLNATLKFSVGENIADPAPSAGVTGANFTGMELLTGSEFLIRKASFNDEAATLSFAGITLGSNSLFKLDSVNFTSVTNFSNLNIAEGAELFFYSSFQKKATFNGTVNGKLTFSGGNMTATQASAPDFSGIEFGSASTFTLEGAGNWSYADFSDAVFGGNFLVTKIPGTEGALDKTTTLQYADFSRATFSGYFDVNGSLNSASFRNATFSGTMISQSTLGSADFTEANFTATSTTTFLQDINNVNFTNAVFAGSLTINGGVSGSDFTGADFQQGSTTNLTGAFVSTIFDGASFAGTLTATSINLDDASFANAVFTGETSIGGGGSNVNFAGADFQESSTTTFDGGKYLNANFTKAVFAGEFTSNSATFTGALFRETTFIGNTQFLAGNIADSDFTLATLEEGAILRLDPNNVSGVKMNQMIIKNDAKLYINATSGDNGKVFEFQNSTVQEGAFLEITGWHRNFLNSKFNGSIFAGTTTFGESAGAWCKIDLDGSDFTGTQFAGTTNFNYANLQNALFDGATMSGNVNFLGSTRRAVNSDPLSDFLNGNLSGISFAEADLSGNIVFKDVNMEGSIFDNAQLTGTVNFTNTQADNAHTGNMNSSSFQNAYVGPNVTFNKVNLTSANFNNATLEDTTFVSSILDQATFQGAGTTFKGTVNISDGSMIDADLTLAAIEDGSTLNVSNMDVSGATINQVTLGTGATLNLVNSYGTGFEFSGSTVASAANLIIKSNGKQTALTNADFSGTTFAGTTTIGVETWSSTNTLSLAGADFSSANFTGTTNFNYADLQSASFVNAQMTGTVHFKAWMDGSTRSAGKMDSTDFTGAYIGAGVHFEKVSLVSSNYTNATIDGAFFNNVNLSKALFQGTVIKGDTEFGAWSTISGTSFDGAIFESEGVSVVTFDRIFFIGTWGGDGKATTFDEAQFNGNVLFTGMGNANGYNDVSFAGASFNNGSNVTFDGTNLTNNPTAFGSTPTYAGTLTFKNLAAQELSFSEAVFQGTSNTVFENTNISAADFDNTTFKSSVGGDGAKLSVKGTVDNVSFENAVFERNTTLNFFDTTFAENNYLNFNNTSFGGLTQFATDSQQTDLSGSDFTDAEFSWDSSKGTMFFLQNTGYTLDQFKTTKNYSVVNGREKYNFRGMDISSNTSFSGQDFRGSQIDSAKFAGLWANDFRDSTYYNSNKPTSYGNSYIDAIGNLGGLNRHSLTDYNNNFLVRAKLPDSSLAGVYLEATSTRVNEGITLEVGSNNDIYAQDGHVGLDVYGAIEMDSSSVFHMRDGAAFEFFFGSELLITVKMGENYILVADYDASSSIAGIDLISLQQGTLSVFGDPEHEWKLELFDYYQDNPYHQLILYYDIPEPATATLSMIGLLTLALCRKRRHVLCADA